MEEKTLLRKVQLTQLEIMKYIDSVCRANGFRYYLCGGSLIGAIRHQGFIPWDDDLDIMMPREDYESLMSYLWKNPHEKYWLQNYQTDKHYWQPYAKIRKKGTLYKEQGQEMLPNEKCGIWIDIFPLDYVSKVNFASLKIRRFLAKTISFSLRIRELELPYNAFSRRYVPWLLFLGLFPKSVLKKIQMYVMSFNTSRKDILINLGSTYEIEKEIYCAEWFIGEKEAVFEDTSFFIPNGYHSYLTQVYGNYRQLPPENKRKGHNISNRCDIVL